MANSNKDSIVDNLGSDPLESDILETIDDDIINQLLGDDHFPDQEHNDLSGVTQSREAKINTVAVADFDISDSDRTDNIPLFQQPIDNAEPLHIQIRQLWVENETLKQSLQKIHELNTSNEGVSEEVDSVQQIQYKLRKLLHENKQHVPTLVYSALGCAITALLISAVLGYLFFSKQSETERLIELVATLEEEVEIIASNNSVIRVKALNEKYKSLTINYQSLATQVKQLNIQTKLIPTTALIDKLLAKNQSVEADIILLLTKVKKLERGKVKSINRSRTQKKINKPNINAAVWVVNLVSYKQEWFARKKMIEFANKGIHTNINTTHIAGDTWFKLSISGFNTQAEADAYAIKIKKLLNLSSVGVTKLYP